MKKYIAPIAKTVELHIEESILIGQSDDYGDGIQLSNRREEVDFTSASESIWGNGWEE